MLGIVIQGDKLLPFMVTFQKDKLLSETHDQNNNCFWSKFLLTFHSQHLILDGMDHNRQESKFFLHQMSKLLSQNWPDPVTNVGNSSIRYSSSMASVTFLECLIGWLNESLTRVDKDSFIVWVRTKNVWLSGDVYSIQNDVMRIFRYGSEISVWIWRKIKPNGSLAAALK